MDISTVTDINQLKALAFDEMRKLELNQQNLRVLNTRISEVEAEQAKQAEEDAKKKSIKSDKTDA